MNKRFLLLGVVTICLLLLGSLPTIVAEEEPDSNSDPFSNLNGVVDLSYDLSLTNNWIVGPSSSTPSDLTNTNLRYNLTSMKSPLDQYFNVGAFMFGSQDSGLPEFMIDGTFEGSELFVKIVNDQYSVIDSNNRLLDWQATLTIKDDINISVLIPETADLGGFPIDLVPTSFTIPGGSGVPPLLVIQSTTNFSYFEDLGNLVKNYGYDGLPFVSPSIFYVESLADANDYWTTVDVDKMFGTAEDPNDNRTIDLTTDYNPGGFELWLDAAFFNTTADFGNVSLYAHWNNAGWLDNFELVLFADIDQSLTLDAEEEFSLVFDLIGTTPSQAPLQIDVGDQGEYIMNMDFSATVDLDNQTEEDLVNSLLDEISASINELDGEVLLNYTVDSMDGLYYHINGYLFNITGFMQDRLPFFSDSGTGAQTPQPIESYYTSINDMDGDSSNFALNLFDASVYHNDSMFYERYDGYGYDYPVWNETSQENDWYHEWVPLQAQDENVTIIEDYMPGIVNAYIYNETDWNYGLTIEENLVNLQSYEVYEGPVEYVEEDYNKYIQIVANESFPMYVNFIAVLEILPPVQLAGFTSYKPMTSPYMMMFGDNNDMSEPSMNVGFGAEDPYVEPPQSAMSMVVPNLQSILPLPARTPDWEQVGGPMVFLEGYIMQISDVITNPDFISFLEEMVASEGLGNSLNIHDFDVGLDWMVNTTHAGAMNWVELDMTMVNNDTENMTITTQNALVNSSESYFWFNNGIFDTAMVNVQMNVDVNSEDWPSGETTTTTVPLADTTTTETTLELTPGFEVVFAIGSLIALLSLIHI